MWGLSFDPLVLKLATGTKPKMNDTFLIIGIVAALWAIFLFVRAPAATLFLSLLTGQLLATQASAQIYSWVNPFFAINDFRYLQLALLVVPVLITLFFLRGRVSKAKLPFEAVPYLLIAAAGVLIAVDYSWALQQKVQSVQNQFGDYRAIVIIAASVFSLVSAWTTHSGHGRGKHGKKH
jgi:hypothetical protein